VSTIVAAYERCLDDAALFGRVIECSVDKQFELDTPSLANGYYSKRAVTVWEPLFKMWVRCPYVSWLTTKQVSQGGFGVVGCDSVKKGRRTRDA
jgi:hypothetical protein